jgi:Predicted membrane protein (DUF2306)
MKKLLWASLVLLAILTSLYPITYFVTDRKFGLLGMKSEALLANVFYNLGFYVHIIFASISLLIGWIQFSSKIRNNNFILHRNAGKVYIISALLSSSGGIYIGFFSTGGLVAATGFILLGVIWFCTTLLGYRTIRDKKIAQHQRMLIYSYACCFAGVTLRIYQPLLMMYFGDFSMAYTVVAWLCWVPNVFVAYLLVQKNGPLEGKTLTTETL